MQPKAPNGNSAYKQYFCSFVRRVGYYRVAATIRSLSRPGSVYSGWGRPGDPPPSAERGGWGAYRLFTKCAAMRRQRDEDAPFVIDIAW